MEYHKAIQDRIKGLEKEIEAVKNMNEPFNIIVGMSNDIGLKYIELWVCNDNAAFDLNINNMDEIKAIIRHLGHRRYFIISTFVDDTRYNYKSWVFKHKTSIHTIQMFAYFFKENQSCKFVQTSTKVVPVMELKCT